MFVISQAKTRMQVQGSVGSHKYKGVFSTLGLIYREEGVAGCFRGLIPSLITVPLFWYGSIPLLLSAANNSLIY